MLSIIEIFNKVQKILAFKQKPWLRESIDFNTNVRKVANNDFEKDFYKLMKNSVFGKIMENLRKRVDIQPSTENKSFSKWQQNRDLSLKIFNEDLASVKLKKQNLV